MLTELKHKRLFKYYIQSHLITNKFNELGCGITHQCPAGAGLQSETGVSNSKFNSINIRLVVEISHGESVNITYISKHYRKWKWKWSRSVMSNSLRPHGLCSPPGSSVHGILQARILEWVAISFSRESSKNRTLFHERKAFTSTIYDQHILVVYSFVQIYHIKFLMNDMF